MLIHPDGILDTLFYRVIDIEILYLEVKDHY